MNQGDHYTCELCGRTYAATRTGAEALAEYEASFGQLAEEDRAVVCEDCYQVIMAHHRAGLN